MDGRRGPKLMPEELEGVCVCGVGRGRCSEPRQGQHERQAGRVSWALAAMVKTWASVLSAKGIPEGEQVAGLLPPGGEHMAAADQGGSWKKGGCGSVRWWPATGPNPSASPSTLQVHLCSPHTTPCRPGRVRQPY